MKKILLILAITVVGLVDAQEIKEPYVIEKINVFGEWRVICVQDYVFIQPVGKSATQLMRDGSKGKTLVPMQPMRCEDYKKTS